MRKVLYYFLFLLLLVLGFACQGHPLPHQLVMVDSLAEVYPDSALTMLADMRKSMTNSPEYVRNYYDLLCIKANDKEYKQHKSTKTIDRLVRFYEKEGDDRLLSVAYYYAGRVYRDLNDAPQALEYFQKVILMLEEQQGKSKLLSKAYSQAGSLFLDQHLYKDALNYLRKSYFINIQNKDTTAICYSLRDISYIYREYEDMDSAFIYCKKAFSLAEIAGNVEMLSDLSLNMASFYLDKEDLKQAFFYLNIAKRNYVPVNISALLSIEQRYFKKKGMIDSVYFCSKELIKLGNVYGKQGGYDELSSYYIQHNMPSEAMQAFRGFKLYTDSIQHIQVSEAVENVNGLYNYNLRAKENSKLKTEQIRYRLGIGVLLSIMVVMLLLWIIYTLYRSRKNQQKKIQEERQRELSQRETEISKRYILENEKKIKDLERNLQETNSNNSELTRQLCAAKEQLDNANKIALIIQSERNNAQQHLAASAICQKFKGFTETSNNTFARPTEEDWSLLEREVDSYYPKFRQRISDVCDINIDEFHVCLLIKIGINPKAISDLVFKSKSGVSMMRKRLSLKAFGPSKTANDWDRFILSL